MQFSEEQIKKAIAAKSAEELLEMAKAEGLSLTEEQAEKYYSLLHDCVELSEDEMEALAGGKGDGPEPKFRPGQRVILRSISGHPTTYEILYVKGYIDGAWEYHCCDVSCGYEEDLPLEVFHARLA